MEQFVKQLNSSLEKFHEMQARSKHEDLSDISSAERQSLLMRAISAVERITGPSSSYSEQIKTVQTRWPHLHLHMNRVMGIAQALREDLHDGYIDSLVELVHADTFSDFLEMAQYLQESGYKDAAAVITGSTLEIHIRALCEKHGIGIESNGKPLKADKMNSDLVKAGAYTKLDQKNVTAWLDLRNKAAHGSYDQYSKEQIDLFLSSVRDFIGRVPA